MKNVTHFIDLRSCPPGISPHTYAFYALKDLAPGSNLVMISAEDPALLLRQLQLQLRNRLAWTCTYHEGTWKAHIRRREDTSARTVADVLSRDHERLDQLFLQALEEMRAGASGGRARTEYFVSLRRHIDVENTVLAPAFPSLLGDAEDNPVRTMLREHEDILKQAGIISDLFREPVVDMAEAEIWYGLLAASLSKHEYREETRLFPQWDIALGQRADADDLIKQIKAALAAD